MATQEPTYLMETADGMLVRVPASKLAQFDPEDTTVQTRHRKMAEAIVDRLMSQYRRHAVVAILIVAAIITPTTDVFTLFVVALPIYLLYELSIQIVRITKRNK